MGKKRRSSLTRESLVTAPATLVVARPTVTLEETTVYLPVELGAIGISDKLIRGLPHRGHVDSSC